MTFCAPETHVRVRETPVGASVTAVTPAGSIVAYQPASIAPKQGDTIEA
jgi:hypothetical protein